MFFFFFLFKKEEEEEHLWSFYLTPLNTHPFLPLGETHTFFVNRHKSIIFVIFTPFYFSLATLTSPPLHVVLFRLPPHLHKHHAFGGDDRLRDEASTSYGRRGHGDQRR